MHPTQCPPTPRLRGVAFLLTGMLLGAGLALPGTASAETATETAPETAPKIATGPEVGEKIPALDALDQHGTPRTFDDLKGPEGLLVLFYRTADW